MKICSQNYQQQIEMRKTYDLLSLLKSMLIIIAQCYIQDNQFQAKRMNPKRSFQLDLKPQPNQTALSQKFPSINFTSTSRALMSLSRKERYESQNQIVYATTSRQLETKKQEFELLKATHSTSNSVQKFRQNQKQQNKILKTLNFVRKYDKQKMLPVNSVTKLPKQISAQLERADKNQSPSKMLIKEENNSMFSGQVKYCDKKFGRVEGYAVSSHLGSLCTVNNTRICVATNFMQGSSKLRQVSFFGLFQGRNGSNRAQYMREYFHNTLINDELFYYNFDKAVSRTFQKIQRDFNYDPRYEGDYSIASSVICVIVSSKLYIIRYGAPNATISMKLGSYIKTLTTEQKQPNPKEKKSHTSLSHYNSKSMIPKQNLHIRMFELSPEYDFVVLGNEGLYQLTNSRNELGANLWRHVIDEVILPNKTYTNRLAKACNRICQEAVKRDNLGRSMSMIAIQFESMTSCFTQPSQLQLPHVKGGEHSFIISKEQGESLYKQINANQTNYNGGSDKEKFAMSPRYMRTFSNLM